MRFFSSSALASAPKLRLAASCSAAETMFGFLPPSPSSPRHPWRRLADPGDYLALGSDKSTSRGLQTLPRRRAMTQMLRRLALFLLGGRQDLHAAAGLLDRRNRRFRRAMNLDIDLGLD